MYQKVKTYIEKHHMLKQQDTVIAGVSGGADSVCLLLILVELKKELDIRILAVHIHHGIRGASADADEAYVRQLCRRLGVELLVFHEDVGAYARQNHLTLEEAGRNVRRQIFESVRNEYNADKIALAHHQNDNAETLIWNLCRGSGLKGICGISPSEGAYIRPFLCIQRKEIELYLQKREISYCTDETNLEDHYTRNKIRNHIIPYLEEEVNEQTVAHMSEMMEQMQELGKFIDAETERYLKECAWYQEDRKSWLLHKEKYIRVPEAIRTYVLHELLCRIAKRRKDIEAVHVKSLKKLMDNQVGRKIHLPYGIVACRCYEGIEFTEETEDTDTDRAEELFTCEVYSKEPGEILFPKSTYTKWFDYDIIKNTVKIRHREAGDYITIDKKGNTQKLKQYFINEKVPSRLRDKIWLVADGHHIMWIVGYRQNQMYQITENTRRVLEIKFNGGEDDGREC